MVYKVLSIYHVSFNISPKASLSLLHKLVPAVRPGDDLVSRSVIAIVYSGVIFGRVVARVA